MQVMEDIDDEIDIEQELEKLYSKKQQSDLTNAIRQLLVYIKNDTVEDNKTFKAITQYNNEISLILANLQKVLIKPEKEALAPIVTVNVNQDLVVNAINKLVESFNKEELNESNKEKKVVEWEHKVNYGAYGRIDSVISKAKK